MKNLKELKIKLENEMQSIREKFLNSCEINQRLTRNQVEKQLLKLEAKLELIEELNK